MHLRQLNRLLADAGVEPLRYGPDRRRWQTLTPTSIITELDRGQQEVQEFADEDALCRHLLVRELKDRPPRRGARLLPPPDAERPDALEPGLSMRWTRPARPFDRPLARGHGLVAVLDTAPLEADPRHGAAQVSVVDVATGHTVVTRWRGAADEAHALVGSDTMLLVISGSRVEAVGARDGATRWARDVPGAVAVVAERLETVVITCRDGSTWGLDLADGATRWRTTGLMSTAFTARGVPALSRFFAVTRDGATFAIDRVDLVTGERSIVAETVLDQPDDAELLVIVDAMDDEAATGHLVVRVRRGHGVMHDLVVRPGSVVSGDPDPAGSSFLTESFAPDRLLLQGRFPDSTPTVLKTLDGERLWSRDGLIRLRGRSQDVSLVELSSAAPDGAGVVAHVEAIADDGTTRWTAPGSIALVDGDDVWWSHDERITIVGARDGTSRRASRRPWARTLIDAPNLLRGWNPDDRHVLVVADTSMQAFAWS